MSEKLQRWEDFYLGDGESEMRLSDEGPWVKTDEADARIEGLERELAALKAKVAMMESLPYMTASEEVSPDFVLVKLERILEQEAILSSTPKVLAVVKTTAQEDISLPPNVPMHGKLHTQVYFDGVHPLFVTVIVLADERKE